MSRSGHKVLDDVEKVLLGGAPGDPVTLVPASGVPDPTAARLAAVRSYLEGQPELRAELGREITKAWRTANGQRMQFQAAVAEHRARILSLAALSGSQSPAGQAAADFQRELSRYLVERQGAGDLAV